VVLVLVVYDISDDQVRRRLSDYLKSKGFTRIQRSAFIGNPPPSIYKDVRRVLKLFIKSESDVIHVFPITEYSLRYMEVYGNPLSDVSELESRRILIYTTKVVRSGLERSSAVTS